MSGGGERIGWASFWKPKDEWTFSLENIDHFAPTGDPDAEFDTYKQHL